jgi:hypothetical protein
MCMLAAIGLWFRRPFAESLSHKLFVDPAFVEWAHCVFALFRSGPYQYVPGVWTRRVPMIPELAALWWNVRRIRLEENEHTTDVNNDWPPLTAGGCPTYWLVRDLTRHTQ